MVTGVCGVGKSTITRELSKRLGITWGDYADMMLEVMGESDKDRIQYLDWKQKREVYDRVEELIAQRFSKTNGDNRIHILENHLSIVQDGELRTFPAEDYEKYNMVGLVVVEATIDEIVTRRESDPNRKRLLENASLIMKQQEINREEARKIREHLGIPTLLVQNNDGKEPTAEIDHWAQNSLKNKTTAL